LFCASMFAQTPDSILTKSEFQSEISKLTSKIKTLEKNNSDLQQTNSFQKMQIDSITLQLSVANSNIQQIADSLHITVTNVSSTNKQTQSQIQDINQTITNRTLYWIIGILAVALLSIFVFFFLRNKLSSSTKNLDSQIAKTNQAMHNEATKLDSKLIEILQTQLSILKEERKTNGATANTADHKLPLKVGNEIYRMRQRISSIKTEDKSLIPLSKSLERLEEEFNQGGYEIVDLLNKQFNDGLSVKATFIPSDNLNPGERIITKVIKPQINFNHQAIQMAEIEVSTGN
jgi:hypothetical protein